MTMSFNAKALGAFRKLGAVALITATLAMFFTACNQTGGGGGTTTPKHAINFSVDITTPNGTLKAKVDGITETETSPIKVEEGKEITFTAIANDGYRVKGWTLDGKPITEAGTNTEYKLKVSKPATVKVSFEEIPPTKYTVTLNQTEHGKVTASPEIPEDKKVDKDTVITFTAKADTGYKVGKWTVTPAEALQAGGADENETAKVKITADTTVSVSFIKKTYAITFSVEDGTGGTLEAKVDGKEISSGDMVEHGKKVEFTPKEEKGYRVKNWTLDGENIGGTAYFTLGVSKPATVTVSFELRPVKGGAVLILSPDHPYIRVWAKTADGKPIEVEGCDETEIDANGWEKGLRAKGTKVILKGKITKLGCSKNELTALNVQGLTTLQGLDCSKNELTSLNVQGLTSLQWVNCSAEYSNNQPLTALDVSGCTSLQELDCYYNELTSLNVQGCASLQKLSCGGNKLTELNVQGLTALQKLDCSENQLTALNVQGLTALQELWCNGNKLTELNVQGSTSLQKLSCGGNKLTELNVQGLTALQELSCGGNKLAALNVQGLTALEELYCRQNQLKSLGISGCTSLKTLECYDNQLNAQAMTELLNALPQREASDNAKAILCAYTTITNKGNHSNFTNPPELKAAFDEAKTNKHWKLQKVNSSGNDVDI